MYNNPHALSVGVYSELIRLKKIYVVGLGSGKLDDMTIKAKRILDSCDIIVGYKSYIDLVKPILGDKIYIESGMKQEVQRCKQVLEIFSKSEKSIALISSGDSGIYGMAGIMLELADNIDIEIIPGITAATLAASIVGAPLTNDFCVISLSDLLTPWDTIERRLKYATMGDFVIVLYNPKSKTRTIQLIKAIDIIKQYRDLDTVVAVVRNAGRNGQTSILCKLSNLDKQNIDMLTTIIIGNSQTYIRNNKIITPRGYNLLTKLY